MVAAAAIPGSSSQCMIQTWRFILLDGEVVKDPEDDVKPGEEDKETEKDVEAGEVNKLEILFLTWNTKHQAEHRFWVLLYVSY